MTASVPYQPPAHGFRTFLILWATQSVSIIGTAVGWFALTVWLAQQFQTQDELGPKLALLGLVGGLPTVLLAPVAGAWADRYDRKRLMLVADVLSGLLSVAGVWFLFSGRMQFAIVVALGFLYPCVGAFHSAAFDTSYAMLVPDAQLPRANGMMQTMWSLSSIVSPGIAALLIALPTGVGGALLVDAVTFFLAAATLLVLVIPSPQRADLHTADGAKSLWSDIGEGARFIWRRRPILWLLGTFTISNFAVTAMMVLTPVLVKFRLAPSYEALGLAFTGALAAMQTAAGVGGVIGGVLFSLWGGLKARRVWGVLIPILVSGVAQTVYGLSMWFYLSLAVSFLLVGLVPVMNSHSQAIWQSQTPREMQGRVFAVRRLVAWVLNPVSTGLAGLLTGWGVEAWTIVTVLGLLTVAWCVANLFNVPLRRVDEPGYLDAYAARAGPLGET